jgi:hypothetical protein
MGPPTLFTIPVLRYMKTYGLTHEQLAMVSVVQREWAGKNPRASQPNGRFHLLARFRFADPSPRARYDHRARFRFRHAILRHPPPQADGMRLERAQWARIAGYIVFWLHYRG